MDKDTKTRANTRDFLKHVKQDGNSSHIGCNAKTPVFARVSEPALLTVPLIVTAREIPGQPPPAVRVRRWLKIGLRTFGIRVEWAPAAPANPASEKAGAE